MLHYCFFTLLLASVGVFSSIDCYEQNVMAEAKEIVDKYSARINQWDGPISGPQGVKNKRIAVIATSMTNGGVLGVVKGMEEAAPFLNWDLRILDGRGSVSATTAAFNQAMALNPDGIAIIGVDLTEQKPSFEAAAAANIPMVSWHSGVKNGPILDGKVFANVTTDPMEVAKSAAMWAYVHADGKPGVVIFTDSTYEFAISKAKKMREVIESLGGTVLEWVDTPLADTSTRMPQLTISLLQKHGKKWTHSLAINDLYYDFMSPSLAASGLSGDGPPYNIAGGDGSESAYQRIRSGQYQVVTVADPLILQGWQLVDELNRAFSNAPWSNYQTPLHLVTKENIKFDGGANDKFDPDNNYREEYKKIWGVK